MLVFPFSFPRAAPFAKFGKGEDAKGSNSGQSSQRTTPRRYLSRQPFLLAAAPGVLTSCLQQLSLGFSRFLDDGSERSLSHPHYTNDICAERTHWTIKPWGPVATKVLEGLTLKASERNDFCTVVDFFRTQKVLTFPTLCPLTPKLGMALPACRSPGFKPSQPRSSDQLRYCGFISTAQMMEEARDYGSVYDVHIHHVSLENLINSNAKDDSDQKT
ncbi:hypothetical protein E5288_WYG002989 [Bos mutus]|uniref:Uncharacterized protein n=1 Tax=Bos mutus TaxID=72004 RepID=A0A6B0S6K0_9CETA|nr:hypothetical protein [Bos mutus]